MFGKIFLIKAYYSLYYWLAINENGATFKMAEIIFLDLYFQIDQHGQSTKRMEIRL